MHQQQRNLAHLSRVSVAGELSIALAHEVNQPLAAILANASAARRFLLHDPPDLRELGEILEAIADDNRRAAAVITRFGSLSQKATRRDGAGGHQRRGRRRRSTSPGDIISRGVSLTKRFGRDLPPVAGDAVQLQQVLLNLIVNACDAMESMPLSSRRLPVTTRRRTRRRARHGHRQRPRLPPTAIDEIFEPFITSKPQRLGLGLAICRSIVADHDGRLSVESRPRPARSSRSRCPPAAAAAPPGKNSTRESDSRGSVSRKDH